MNIKTDNKIELELPNWVDALQAVCSCTGCQLSWGLPEPWVHAELFSKFKLSSSKTGWEPFSMEVPYLTYYPVTLPKPENRDWTKDGAFKWADICLHQPASNQWCWLELKVRHSEQGEREKAGANSALDALAKDYVGLCGMDIFRTSENWHEPEDSIKAYWIEETLGSYATKIVQGKHYLVSVYLQLNGSLNEEVLSDDKIKQRIEKWHETRSKRSQFKLLLPGTHIANYRLDGGHSLIICRSEESRIAFKQINLTDSLHIE